jgi:glutathione peroxidase
VVRQEQQSPLYTFELSAEDGAPIKLSDFKDKVVLIVNVATQCNLAAKQYKELEALYQAYKDKGLEIIASPSNDFGQELEDAEERTCALEDHVATTFLITDIVHVVDRKVYNACPLYQWLNEQGTKTSIFGLGSVQWNFHKFLIGKDGEFIDWFAATTSPTAKKVRKAIEKALAA